MKRKEVKTEKSVKTKKTHFDHYLASITSFDKPFFMTVIFDYAYCISVFVVLLCLLLGVSLIVPPLAATLQSLAGIFSALSPTEEISPAMELMLGENFRVLQWFYIQAAFIFFGGVFALFAVTSTYKAFIWAHLTKQKLTWKYFRQFFMVNILWQALWLFLATLTFFGFTVTAATYLLLAELFFYMYFTPFLRALFTEKHTIKQIYKETFVHGTKKLPHFVVPVVLMIITITFVLWIVALLLQFIQLLGVMLLLVVLIFLTMSWVRFYFSIVIKSQHS